MQDEKYRPSTMDTASPRLHGIARESKPSAPAVRKTNKTNRGEGRGER